MYAPKKLAVVLLGLMGVSGPVAPTRGDPPVPSSSAEPKRDAREIRQITLTGIVTSDERKLARISVRAPGKSRIDKLYVATAGDRIKRGDALAELYSPDLVVTAQNLLDAQRGGNRDLERIARERLVLWGIDNDQIDGIVKTGKPLNHVTVRSPFDGHVIRKHRTEGQYVEEGARLYDVSDLSTVWVEADINDQADVPFLKEKLAARLTAKAVPDGEFSGEVLGLFQDANTRTLKVRFAVKNPRHELLPGMLATVLLKVPAGPPEKKNAKLTELLKERLATLRELVKQTQAAYMAGRVSFDRLEHAQKALLLAELELCDSDKERVVVLEKVVALTKEFEKNAIQRYKDGTVPQSDALMAAVSRLEAEIALERAKAR